MFEEPELEVFSFGCGKIANIVALPPVIRTEYGIFLQGATGDFDMGSNYNPHEKPVHHVTIANPFAIGRREVTFTDWDQCVAGGGCNYPANDHGFGRDTRPVIDVSWDDAQMFVRWLSQKTGKIYRLPSEAEWEYAARAGSTTAYWWGKDVGKGRANCADCSP